MPLYEPVIPVRYATLLVDTVRALDAAQVRPILANAGMPLKSLQDQAAVLAIGEFDRLTCAAVASLARQDFGFEYGKRLGIDNHELLSLALRRCKSAHELLSMMRRYWRLTSTCFFIHYQRRWTGGEVIFRPIAPMSAVTLHVMIEMFAVSFHRDLMAMTGNRPGLTIHLPQARPAYGARFDALQPTRFRFSSGALPQARCVLSSSLLDSELNHRGLPEHLTERTAVLSDDTPARTRQCAALVQMILEEAEGEQPDAHAIGDWLNLSPRTLLRYLAAEGHSLRELGTTIRHRRACHMLATTQQPIGQIAQRLGYGSVIAFSTAFKRSAGVSPRAFRTSQCQG